eukprot:TRINITY_DN75_c0_g2_i2.p1 TRINITY_DN75_c0_g2~~TRINITY_DN75_c0_g2_i2.p1  ORF type:complete len:443 (-),score=68.70 TRINITY_DN75_c0_g2_i2:31-1359(-)
MVEEFFKHPQVTQILKEHPSTSWPRVVKAIVVFGARELVRCHPRAVSSLASLEKLAYNSHAPPANFAPDKSAMQHFFNELKMVKENLNVLDRKVQTHIKQDLRVEKEGAKRLEQGQDKENNLELHKRSGNERVASAKQLQGITRNHESLTTHSKGTMSGIARSVASYGQTTTFQHKPTTETHPKGNAKVTRTLQPSASNNALIESKRKPMAGRSKQQEKADSRSVPKYLQNVQSKIKSQVSRDRVLNKEAADEYFSKKERSEHVPAKPSTTNTNYEIANAPFNDFSMKKSNVLDCHMQRTVDFFKMQNDYCNAQFNQDMRQGNKKAFESTKDKLVLTEPPATYQSKTRGYGKIEKGNCWKSGETAYSSNHWNKLRTKIKEVNESQSSCTASDGNSSVSSYSSLNSSINSAFDENVKGCLAKNMGRCLEGSIKGYNRPKDKCL